MKPELTKTILLLGKHGRRSIVVHKDAELHHLPLTSRLVVYFNKKTVAEFKNVDEFYDVECVSFNVHHNQ